MDLEFKSEAPNLTLTPTLTFDAPPAPAVVAPAAPAPQQEKPKEEIPLTPEEQAQVEAFSKQIDLANSSAILNYGVGAQRKLSSFSEKARQEAGSSASRVPLPLHGASSRI